MSEATEPSAESDPREIVPDTTAGDPAPPGLVAAHFNPLAPPPDVPVHGATGPVPMASPPRLETQPPPPAAALVEQLPVRARRASTPPPPVAAADAAASPPPPTQAAATSAAPPPPQALDAFLNVEPDLESIADGGANPLPTDGPISPYLVLGIPYGADIKTARAAFVTATKRLAEFATPPFRLDDLTWALHQIEHGESDTFELRIPADPNQTLTHSEPGLFAPLPMPMPRATEPVGDQTRERYLHRALHQAVVELAQHPDVAPKAPPLYSVQF